LTTFFILLSRYQKPQIGPGQLIFAAVFLIAFIAVVYWSFSKDKKITRIHFGNSGILALAIGGGLLLMILVKIFLRQSN
jgi:cbb3-type cytochrome oxidase subunit 3